MTYTVTPTHVYDPKGVEVHESSKPLAWAIERVPGGQGAVIEPGSYALGHIDQSFGGHFRARVPRSVAIPRVEGSDAVTVFFKNGPAIKPVVFTGLVIMGSERTAISTNNKQGETYALSFHDCLIDGGYDHAERSGPKTKWGFRSLGWVGALLDCQFENIRDEHGMYPHSPSGDVLIRGCRFRRCGRAGVQVVGRDTETGFSPYRMTVRDTVFEDCGLNDGASHFTCYGMDEFVLRDVISKIGLNTAFRARYMETHPEKKRFGTGFLAQWGDNGRASKTKGIWMHNVAAVTADGCGSAPQIKITNAEKLRVTGSLIAEAGGDGRPAIIKAASCALDYQLTGGSTRGTIDLFAEDD